MTDHIDRVRKRAQAEAERQGFILTYVEGRAILNDYAEGLVAGQVSLASRLTREKIVEVIENNVDMPLSSRLGLAHAILDLIGESDE